MNIPLNFGSVDQLFFPSNPIDTAAADYAVKAESSRPLIDEGATCHPHLFHNGRWRNGWNLDWSQERPDKSLQQ